MSTDKPETDHVARPILNGHQPVLGQVKSSTGSLLGVYGCACMTTREWFGYLTSHGGPGWLAYADHIAAQVTSPSGDMPARCLCGVVDDRGDGTCGNCGLRIMTADDETVTSSDSSGGA